ncbi:MAG: CBS domain-containing protein [Mariprofundaceae bacterium]
MKITLIKDIETRDVISLSPEAFLGEALGIMDDKKISFLVMIKENKPVGVLTERDVVRLVAQHEITDQTALHQVMTSPVHTVSEDADIFKAYDALITHQIRHLMVVDSQGNIAGTVTQSDFLGNLGVEYFIDLKHVSSIMTRRLFTLTGDAPVQNALDIMVKESISCVIVVEDGRPVGILTERDVMHLSHVHTSVQTASLREVMATPVQTLPETAYVPEVNHFMKEKRIRHVAIVDHDKKLVGLISQSNLTSGLEKKYVSFLKRVLKTRDHTIQKGREQYKALFEFNPNATYFLDTEGIIQGCNVASTLLTGHVPEAIVGKRLAQFIVSGDVSGFEQALGKVRRNHPAHCECSIHSLSGETITIFLSLIPVATTGEVKQIYSIAHDITEHKRAEEDLKIRLDEIERMNRLMIGRELKMKEMRDEMTRLNGEIASLRAK